MNPGIRILGGGMAAGAALFLAASASQQGCEHRYPDLRDAEEEQAQMEPKQKEGAIYSDISDASEESRREIFEALYLPGEEEMDVDVQALDPEDPEEQGEPDGHLDVLDGHILPLAKPATSYGKNLGLSQVEAMRILMEFQAREEEGNWLRRMTTGVDPREMSPLTSAGGTAWMTDTGVPMGYQAEEGMVMERVMVGPRGIIVFPERKIMVFPNNTPDSVREETRMRIIVEEDLMKALCPDEKTHDGGLFLGPTDIQ